MSAARRRWRGTIEPVASGPLGSLLQRAMTAFTVTGSTEPELSLFSCSLERLNDAPDAVGIPAFDLDWQRADDLVRASRGAVFDRWFVIDVLPHRVLVTHVRPLLRSSRYLLSTPRKTPPRSFPSSATYSRLDDGRAQEKGGGTANDASAGIPIFG